jgi:hypothetical protein
MAQLQATKGDLLIALHSLQQQLLSGSAAAAGGSAGASAVSYAAAAAAAGGAGCPAEWVDEVEVLGAIYGEELDASQQGVVTLAVEGGEQVRGCGFFFLGRGGGSVLVLVLVVVCTVVWV